MLCVCQSNEYLKFAKLIGYPSITLDTVCIGNDVKTDLPLFCWADGVRRCIANVVLITFFAYVLFYKLNFNFFFKFSDYYF